MAQDKGVCVVGLGYIGFPTAVFLAAAGHRVLGVDVRREVVEAVNAGERAAEEEGFEELYRTALRAGRLRAGLAPEPADAFFICVPTPARTSPRYGGREADLDYVGSAARSLAPLLRPGNVVILESTVPPGTTEDFLRPLLEESGLRAHRDPAPPDDCFFLAHCPERVIPGRIAHELVHNDRVIGGLSREAARRAADLYGSFVAGRITLTDAATAETVKLMENTFRDVNVALANEFALLCERLGVNAWEAVALANRHPRVTIHRPGPGVGGHCIPVDPWFLVERAPETAPLIRQARAVNDAMPGRVAERVRACLAGRGDRVALLGLAYKPNVGDLRESPSLEVAARLRGEGLTVTVHDPFVPAGADLHAVAHSGDDGAERLAGLRAAGSVREAAAGADLVVVLVGHRQYLELDPALLVAGMRSASLFDATGSLDHARWEAAGFAVRVLGRPEGRTSAPAEEGGRGRGIADTLAAGTERGAC